MKYKSVGDRYINKVRSQVYDFLNSIPYSELTVALSKELGVSNLHINYSIKDVSVPINIFECAMKYKSNDLAADSKLLSTIYREYKLASFGYDTVDVYLQNGKRFSTEIFLDNFEDFDVNQKLKFQFTVGLHLHIHILMVVQMVVVSAMLHMILIMVGISIFLKNNERY